MAKPKLALIPASQGTKLYSVLPADGVGDFNFSRNTGATRINKDGLIETVAVGKSRLNYPLIDGKVVGCPSHLLEPERTNLVTYSEDFSNSSWNKLPYVAITPNTTISPIGFLDADTCTFTTFGTNTQLYKVISTSGSTQTISIFIKYLSGSGTNVRLSISSSSTKGVDLTFSNNGETLSAVKGASVNDFSIEKHKNNWFRVSISVAQSASSTEFNLFKTNGSETDSYAIWGAQLESNQSYQTSYIPTTNSAVTRVAETANGAGDASTFNSSEGVLMAEISALADDGTNRVITLNDGSTSNRVQVYFNTSNQINVGVSPSGSGQPDISYTVDIKSFLKVAFKYKTNDFALWVNGIKVGENLTGIVPTGLNALNFDNTGGTLPFYGNVKQIQYFDSALNDSDLEKITSWTSFTDLANGQLYSIK